MLLNIVFVTHMKSSLVSAFCLSIAREHQKIAWSEQNRIEVSETFTWIYKFQATDKYLHTFMEIQLFPLALSV